MFGPCFESHSVELNPFADLTLPPPPLPQDMPLVGFGIWKVPAANAAEACYNAIKLGYRHIDGAHDYQNSKEAGAGVRKALEDGLCKREELFITSKLWNNYHAKPHVLEMAKFENENWGVGYLDLVSWNCEQVESLIASHAGAQHTQYIGSWVRRL